MIIQCTVQPVQRDGTMDLEVMKWSQHRTFLLTRESWRKVHISWLVASIYQANRWSSWLVWKCWILISRYIYVFQVDPSGPLANLRKLMFSPEGFQTMKQWLAQYWYIVMASIVALFLFMVSTTFQTYENPMIVLYSYCACIWLI